MSIAGFNSAIYIAGTATVFTDEAFTDLGTGVAWQITSTAKQAWSYLVIPDFEDNGVPILSADILSIDYLFGIVTFTGVKVGPITATGEYIPLLAIAEGYDYSVSFTNADLDDTEFGDTAYSHKLGLQSCSGSLSLHDSLSTDQDGGAGTRKLQTVLTGKAPVLLSLRPDSATVHSFRIWALLTKGDVKAGVADLVGSAIDFINTAVYDSSGRAAWFGYL